jgi:flagellar basal-body rod protein FlgG
MIRAFHTSATGMQAQQFMVDNSANNLANVNTTGFKRNQVQFQDLIYLTQRAPGVETLQGAQVPTSQQIGHGVRVAGNGKTFGAGTLENTTNPLDVSIEGQGFFQITFPDGSTRYTRDGSFRINGNGQLVNPDGFFLSPSLTIPADALEVSIGTDGTVSVITSSSPNTSTQVGNITLARFANPAGLSAEGRNLFRESASSGAPIIGNPGQNGNGLLRQAFLERSNVEVVQELVNLLLAQRAFEFNSRAIRVADDMLADVNQLVR